jgi:hypothetical protein
MIRLAVIAALLPLAVVSGIITIGSFIGLPVSNPWFDVVILLVFGGSWFRACVNGMPEPTLASSDWYVWAYRSLHSLAGISTAYAAHKLLWKYMTGDKEEGQ